MKLVMAFLFAAFVVAACSKPPPPTPAIVKEWATVVTPDRSPVHLACKTGAPPAPVPKSGPTSSHETARYASRALDAYVQTRKLHELCSEWARGQR